jgi:hypothetical protein
MVLYCHVYFIFYYIWEIEGKWFKKKKTHTHSKKQASKTKQNRRYNINITNLKLKIVISFCLSNFAVFCPSQHPIQGRIQDFKLGGAHLKKLRRAEGGAKIFGVFRVNKHDFTPKKSFFFQFWGGGGAGCALP